MFTAAFRFLSPSSEERMFGAPRTARFGRALTLATITVGTLFLHGCTDVIQDPVTLEEDASALVQGLSEQEALDRLTHALAVALASEDLRARVLHHLQASRYTTAHKVPYSAVMSSALGKDLAAEMSNRSGLRASEIVAYLALIRPLELYMPVDEHRQTWTGGDDLLVLGELEEDVAPTAFDLAGNVVQLLQAAPPSTPVLALVPVETDFTAPLEASFINANSRGGAAIGTWQRPVPSSLMLQDEPMMLGENLREVDDESGGSGESGGSTTVTGDQRGIGIQEYITHFRTWNDHEPWWKDDPEFTIFVAGTTDIDSNAEYRKTFNIDESIWTNDEGWKRYPYNLKFMLWDVDYGTRVTVECIERDSNSTVKGTVSGKTTIFGVEVSFTGEFDFADDHDPCGKDEITARLSTGEWWYIPDGNNPEYDGTSDLQWYGYGG